MVPPCLHYSTARSPLDLDANFPFSYFLAPDQSAKLNRNACYIYIYYSFILMDSLIDIQSLNLSWWRTTQPLLGGLSLHLNHLIA